ncbi:MAG: tetratricopeptide repeat protein [Bacteroidota bacterium]
MHYWHKLSNLNSVSAGLSKFHLPQIEGEDADFHTLRGEILIAKGELSSAASAFEKAMALENCPDQVYSSLAEIYLEMGAIDKALKVYKSGDNALPKESEYYTDVHSNGGFVAHMTDHFKLAKEIYTKLYETHPLPSIASKLIQAYYALEDYKAGNALKSVIYEAWEKGELDEEMEKDFCFDQFIWNCKFCTFYPK